MSEQKKYALKKFGPITKRRDYSKTVNYLPVTDLVETQKKSYEWFLKEGIQESFKNIYPITSTNGRITIDYVDSSLRLEKPESEYDAVKLAKQKGTTYSVKIYAKLRKIDDETGEVKDQEVLFGELPCMTSGATFVINGLEKVIVSQLLRSPGSYFGINVRMSSKGASDKELFNKLEIIPKYGIWLEIFHSTTSQNIKDFVKVSIDKNKPISISTFLRSFGMTRESIISLFGDLPILQQSLKKDNKTTETEALEYIHGIIKRGDRITDDSKKNFYSNLLFNRKRYDLSETGRFIINRKLNLVERITNTILAENLVTTTGNVLFKKGQTIDFNLANDIQEAFNKGVLPMTNIPDISGDIYAKQLETNPSLFEKTKISVVKVWPNQTYKDEGHEPITVIGNDFNAKENFLLLPDIIASISYYFNITLGLGSEDDPDSLINKRVSSVGELLQNQLQIGLTKIERASRERMSAKDPGDISPKNITNNKLIYNQFKTFFNSSQLSQFMDQVNPLAEISNKRRVTSLGPGGLNRETAVFEVRDVHATHYGRICPIETPEGPNIGLILNFAIYAKVNDYGFIETPYFKVTNGKVDSKPTYLAAIDERGLIFAQSSIDLDENNCIVPCELIARKDGEYIQVSSKEIDYIDVSSSQMTSIASSAIPFLENNDANRALMGANMQRQAVPLLVAEAPFVGTGIESSVAQFSAANIKSLEDGEITYVDSQVVKVQNQDGKTRKYDLRTFERSNQDTLISQHPIVSVGDKIKKNEILVDGPSFDKGEMALGKNVLVAFSTWNGYNFEDAIIISERLVKEDVFTSIHIEEQEIQFRNSKVGDDELTTEIPNVSNFSKRNLDEFGIVKVGSEVLPGDVLVGRVSPKGEDNPTPEEKLIQIIFAQKSRNVKDTSLKVKHGHSGTVIDVQVLSRENDDKLQDDVFKIVRVFIAQKRKIKVGDKMAGRHGNKGIISTVLPIQDMPHLEDGTPIDILLNPQGVPSRMNIGQVLEMHLGMAARTLGVKFVTPVFDGIRYNVINEILDEAKLPSDGKFDLYDPITGKKFDKKVSVGVMYMLKLAHMVDDKMHARSVGPYSLITQQPLGGKSQNGGQRFGEMETWAIESYGASNVLQELLTYKSDNILGRNKVYNSLTSGAPLPAPGTPESFNVLAYELRGLGMKLSVETIDDSSEKEGK